MRKASTGMLALLAFALARCGSSAHFADKARPPTPINLSVYVNDAKVSISPNSVGAGPVMFIITNQASQAVQLTVRPAAGGAALATTAPINPQATSSVSVDFRPGQYTVGTSPTANTLSSATISSASLHVGKSRANGNGALLEP
jgi:hypothetical protein